MSNWDEMDQKILVGMSEIGIPEEEVERITPWNRATRKIIWGMILNLFTVAFYGLDLIIPFIGDILLTLGLRSLKKTNKGFRRAYALAWIHLSLRLVSIAGSATPIYEEEYVGILQVVLITAAFIALLATLKQGIDKVIDSRIGETKNPINGLILWYVILIVVAATGLGEFWLITVGLILAMICIVYKTLKMGRILDDYGYAVVPSVIGISGKVLGTILVAIALVIIVVFTVLFGRVDMNYEETTLEIGQQQTRGMLIQKGFPKKVIADMKDDEVEGFADVVKVETQAAYSNGPGWDMEQILVLCEKKDGNVIGVAWFKDQQGRVLQGIDGIALEPSVSLKNFV